MSVTILLKEAEPFTAILCRLSFAILVLVDGAKIHSQDSDTFKKPSCLVLTRKLLTFEILGRAMNHCKVPKLNQTSFSRIVH